MLSDTLDENLLSHYPADIFNVSFLDDEQLKPIEGSIGKVVTATESNPKLYLPVYYQAPSPQSRSGRRNELDTEIASRQIDIALGSRALYASTVLREIGFNEYDINKKLSHALSGSPWLLSTTLKQGRLDCRKYFNIPSAKLLKGAANQFKDANGRLKVKKEKVVDSALFGLSELSHSQNRTKRLNKELHDMHKIVRDKKYSDLTTEVYKYRSDSEKPKNAVDGWVVAHTAGVEPSSFWGEFSILKYVYSCAIPLGYFMRDQRYGFDVQQIYTIYRLCTHDFQHTTKIFSDTAPLTKIFQNLMIETIDSIFTKELFLAKAYKICQEFDLFSWSKLTANQIALLSELNFGNRRFFMD